MSKRERSGRQKAALPRGLRDLAGEEWRALQRMVMRIAEVFEQHGFEPLATPALEFTEALGKFLPDQDRPNEGVFSLRDEDEQWLSLRYDLTAPLARYVAENFDALPKPFRRYQWGPVWRNEKPGPGRYREFLQIDADTVGTASPAADAEMCMLAADALEALGISRGDYVIRVSSRKVMDGVLDASGVTDSRQRVTVMRAVDKQDRLGTEGVRLLLGAGRKDESGDFTKGAGLSDDQIAAIIDFLRKAAASAEAWAPIEGFGDRADNQLRGGIVDGLDLRGRAFSNKDVIASIEELVGLTEAGRGGVDELTEIIELCETLGYGSQRIRIDPSVVRGLEYYTGPVYEAELTFETTGEDGRPVRFGSVGGGGRYDDLVARFRGEPVPATGFSVGVSRLYAALEHLGRHAADEVPAPVVVLVMDRERQDSSFAMARELRAAGIRAEMYMGTSGMKAQMKYADRRGAPCVVIEGTEERAQGVVTIKDLIEGSRLAEEIEDRAEWREARPAQETVARGELVAKTLEFLARHGLAPGAGR